MSKKTRLEIAFDVLDAIIKLPGQLIDSMVGFPKDFGDGGDMTGFAEYVTPSKFQATGNLRYSTRLNGTFCRFHEKEHLKLGAEFWESFVDGPWKWASQQRYAGKNLNCGSYFSRSVEGAKAEGNYYEMAFAAYDLLDVEAEFNNLLDLTYEENIRAIFREWLKKPDDPFEEENVQLLLELIDVATGGNRFTDLIGYKAYRAGYSGILFFGARAIEPARKLIEWGWDDDRNGMPTSPQHFRDWRADLSFQNLIVFSGFDVTRNVAHVLGQ